MLTALKINQNNIFSSICDTFTSFQNTEESSIWEKEK